MDYQQPHPQLLSQPQPEFALLPLKPQPPQQTRMSIRIMIQVQPIPPKQLLHILKTSFFVFIIYYAGLVIYVTAPFKKIFKKIKKVFDFS